MTILAKHRQLRSTLRSQASSEPTHRSPENVFSGCHTVLHVDDDPTFRRLVSFKLNRDGIVVQSCGQPAAATKKIAEINPAAVLLDIHMPPYSGIDVLRDIRRRWPTLPVLVLSGLGDRATRRAAVSGGVARYLHKSTTDWSTLRRHVEEVLVSSPPLWVAHQGRPKGEAEGKPHADFE